MARAGDQIEVTLAKAAIEALSIAEIAAVIIVILAGDWFLISVTHNGDISAQVAAIEAAAAPVKVGFTQLS